MKGIIYTPLHIKYVAKDRAAFGQCLVTLYEVPTGDELISFKLPALPLNIKELENQVKVFVKINLEKIQGQLDPVLVQEAEAKAMAKEQADAEAEALAKSLEIDKDTELKEAADKLQQAIDAESSADNSNSDNETAAAE